MRTGQTRRPTHYPTLYPKKRKQKKKSFCLIDLSSSFLPLGAISHNVLRIKEVAEGNLGEA